MPTVAPLRLDEPLRWPEEALEKRGPLPAVRGAKPDPESDPDPGPDQEPVRHAEQRPLGRPVDPALREQAAVVRRATSRRSGLQDRLRPLVPFAILAAFAVAVIGAYAYASSSSGTTTEGIIPTPSPSAGLPSPDAGLTSDPYASGAPTATASPGIGPDRLRSTDFPALWQLHYGAADLRARRIRAKDYAGCRATLRDEDRAGCRYAVQMTYRALRGRLRMTHLIYDFGTAAKAGRAADRLKADPGVAKRPDASQLPGSAQGWFQADDYGKYVVFTMVTAVDGVPATTCKEFTTYGNTDLGAAILFRL